MEIISRKKAKEKGLKIYFTGLPCKHNHLDYRRTNNGECLTCAKNERKKNQPNRLKRYLKRHGKEKINQQRKESYLKRTEGHVLWRQDGRTKDPQYSKNWRKNNPQKVKEYYNKPEIKKSRQKWNHLNRGKKNFYTRMRQQQIKQATPVWANKEVIKQIYVNAATLTLKRKKRYEVDHIVPLKGINPHTRQHIVCGLHVPENLQILNKEKHKKKLNYFMVE